MFVFKFLFPFLAPFFLGLFFALVFDSPLSYLEGRGWSRNICSLVLVIASFLSFPVIIIFVLIGLWQELQGFPGLGQLECWSKFVEPLPLFSLQLNQMNFTGLLVMIFRWALAIPDLLLIWFLTAICTYFLCRDKDFFTRLIVQRLLCNHKSKFFQLYHKTTGALWHLLRVQFLFMTITTIMSVIFFVLLEVPYGLLLGLLVGTFDILPILGPGLIYLALSLFYIWSRKFAQGIAILFAYLILLTVRQWSEPSLISNKLGLHPLFALLGVYMGFKIWGLFGAILGPIILVFIKTFTEIFELA